MNALSKILLISATVIGISACSAPGPGPMLTMSGPVHTPVFEPIALDVVKDGSEKVYFKEFTVMYDRKEAQLSGVFFITDNGAYMVKWDSRSYQYNLQYKIHRDNILSISDDKVIRSFWPDSNLLVIKDKQGHEVGFSLKGKEAARTFLHEISDK
ncbi:hypothetical protein EH243_01380 [Amphritea opalescens]|uniref:Copper resistance protein NlpE n=1 Tax=Amphritea opalescens TaxID=2490544 RepID=A0A430KVT9_9GAMM|nr:hypothetical protein [Amphritea opalescens]RTE67627.1 hypothetical protein EH243_01380 [Amphritea opalescens]